MGKTGLGIFGICAAAVLFACAGPDNDGETTEAEAVDVSGSADEVCAADDFAYLVGQSRAEAAAAQLPEPFRVYGQDDIITMDYSARRLNVVIGDNDIVTEVKCG